MTGTTSGTSSRAVDYTDDDSPPLGRELGTSFGYEQLFSAYENGLVFSYDVAGPSHFKEMLDTDGKASGIEKLLTYPIIACPYGVEEVKGDRGEAEFVRQMFEATEYNEGMQTPLETVIAQVTWSMTVRRTYFEKVFKLRESDGKIVYDKLAWRPPETCELALDPRNGEFRGFRQQPYLFGEKIHLRPASRNGWIFIPPKRAFVYIHGTWRDPVDGISSMQVPYWCWQTKRKIRYLWYQFMETTALPKTIVKNSDEQRARSDARKVATLRSRSVLGITSDTDISTLESSGRGAGQYIEALQWLDSEMSNSILAGFMDLTSSAASGKGSYALSQDQSTLFLRTRRVVARDIARQITTQVIGDIVRYNFGRDAACPKFAFGPLSETNEEAMLALFTSLTQSSQSHALPKEFLDQLTVRTAQFLELNPDKVQKSLDTINEKYDNPLSQVVGAVAVAANAVQTANAGGDPMEALEPKEGIKLPPPKETVK